MIDKLPSPNPQQPGQDPSVTGHLYPELIATGNRGSSLLAALAIAINSVRNWGDTEEIFRKLTAENNDSNTRTDSVRGSESRIKAVQNFKLPLLREVAIEPLIPANAPSLTRRNPVSDASEAIYRKSAVVFPLPHGMIRKMISGRGLGRTFWGAVTAYQEKPAPPAEEASSQVEFTVAVPLPKFGVMVKISEEQLNGLLRGNTRAYTVAPNR